MTKNRLNTLALILVSMLAVACGDAGMNPQDGESDFGGEAGAGGDGKDVGGQGGNAGDAGQGGQGGDPDTGIEPFCGDGFLDADEQCDDGNEEDGDGCSSACELQVIDTEGQIAIDIVIDDLTSNEQPLEDSCSGSIALEIDGGAITGDGRCFLDNNANFLDYVLVAEVDADGALEGEVEVVLNGKPHALVIVGSFVDGVLSLEFEGVTLVISNIRAIWNGEITADLN